VTEKLKPGVAQQGLGIVGAIFGIAVGRYTGINLLIPLAGAFLFGWIFKKVANEKAQPMLAAFAVQGGHFLWMGLGFAIRGTLDRNVADLVILAVGLTWLAAAPGLGATLLCAAYQLLAVAMNVYMFIQAEFGTPEHKALVVHIVLRIVALATLFMGLTKLTPKAAAGGPSTAVGPYAPPAEDADGK
jgi:hypothetical protein